MLLPCLPLRCFAALLAGLGLALANNNLQAVPYVTRHAQEMDLSWAASVIPTGQSVTNATWNIRLEGHAPSDISQMTVFGNGGTLPFGSGTWSFNATAMPSNFHVIFNYPADFPNYLDFEARLTISTGSQTSSSPWLMVRTWKGLSVTPTLTIVNPATGACSFSSTISGGPLPIAESWLFQEGWEDFDSLGASDVADTVATIEALAGTVTLPLHLPFSQHLWSPTTVYEPGDYACDSQTLYLALTTNVGMDPQQDVVDWEPAPSLPSWWPAGLAGFPSIPPDADCFSVSFNGVGVDRSGSPMVSDYSAEPFGPANGGGKVIVIDL